MRRMALLKSFGWPRETSMRDAPWQGAVAAAGGVR